MIPKPFPHQTTANSKLNPLDYAALLADMGTGKSRIAIDWFTHKHLTEGTDVVIIIAPSVVARQWHEEQLPTHCGVHYKSHAYQAKKTKKYLKSLDNFIMSAKYKEGLHIFCLHFETFASRRGEELVKQVLSATDKPPVIIIDESSRIKNPDALSVKSITSLRKKYPDSFRMIMSGTPASKSPVDLWSQFDFLTYNYFKSGYVAFKAMHTVRTYKKLTIKGRLVSVETPLDRFTYDKIKSIVSRNTKDGRIHPDVPQMVQSKFNITEQDFWFVVNSPKFQRFKHLDKLQEKIAPVTYAVKREDCIDLPPKVYQRIACKLNATQKKLIKELVKYSATVYDDKMLTIEVKALIGLRVLQICGGNFSHLTDLEGKFESKPIKGANSKIQYLLNDIPEIGSQQIIVCAVYTTEIEEIYKKVSKIAEVGVLYGDTTETMRTQYVKEFKEGLLQGLIMNPFVGGYGLNLQNASVQYWYSRNYRTEVRLQSEDRLHRIGTTRSPVYKDLLSDIKFEQDVLDVLKEGKDINDVFVNKAINKVFKL